MKYLLLALPLIFTGCYLPPEDYVEYKDYSHIKSSEIVCKPINRVESSINKSTNLSVKTTYKCLFLKEESTIINPHQITKRQELEKMLTNP